MLRIRHGAGQGGWTPMPRFTSDDYHYLLCFQPMYESCFSVVLFRPDAMFDTVPNYTNLHPHVSNEEECFNQSPITDCSLISHHMLKYVHFNKNITHYNL